MLASNAGVKCCRRIGRCWSDFPTLKHGTAARATANFYLVPGVTAVMAWLFLGEGLSLAAVCGLIVATLGCRPVGGSPRRQAGQAAAVRLEPVPEQP